MKRNTILIAAGVFLAVLAIGLGIFLSIPRPELIEDDAWAYALLASETGDWALVEQDARTAYDILPPSIVTGSVESLPPSLRGIRQMYVARFSPATSAELDEFTTQIILYADVASAQAAFSAETPNPQEWRTLPAPALGDEARLYQATAQSDDVNVTPLTFYRLEARYLNAIISLGMGGTVGKLRSPDEITRLAGVILAKMRDRARPQALNDLREYQQPDLRTYLVTQAQLAELDDKGGNLWVIDPRFLSQWTPNSSFGEGTQSLLTRLGRVTGYQQFLLKPLNAEERANAFTENFFQQITYYRTEQGAEEALNRMAGLENALEVGASGIGNRARAWNTIVNQVQPNGATNVVAASEIAFRWGNYVASVRLTSRPLTETEYTPAQSENASNAYIFALRLAANLRGQP